MNSGKHIFTPDSVQSQLRQLGCKAAGDMHEAESGFATAMMWHQVRSALLHNFAPAQGINGLLGCSLVPVVIVPRHYILFLRVLQNLVNGLRPNLHQKLAYLLGICSELITAS